MQVEFILDYRSPYAYLANARVARYGHRVEYQPVDIVSVMQLVNNQPSPRCPAKARYAAVDAARWAELYGIGFSPNVALLQAMTAGRFDGTLPVRVALAAQDLGVFRAVNDALFAAFWAGNDDLVSAAGRDSFLRTHGIDAPALWRAAEADSIRRRIEDDARLAADRGVFGVPTFFVGHEMFFGNDRLEFVEALLKVPQRPQAV